MNNTIPDYSSLYFPPPPGSVDPSFSSPSFPQSSSNTNYPPPPAPRVTSFSRSRQSSAPPAYPAPQSPSFQQQTYPQPLSPRIVQHALYQPHAAALRPVERPQIPTLPEQQYSSNTPQTSPQPSPFLQPPSMSAARPASPAFRTRFATLSLHHTDTIRFLRLPSALFPIIREAVQTAWPRGIQAEFISPSSNSIEIKLKGNPWGIASGEIKVMRSAFGEDVEGQAVHAQRVICSLLRVLHEKGWVLMLSTDISNVPWDADTLIFRHQAPAPAPCEWFSVVFSASNKLRFVDAPQELCTSVITRFITSKRELRHKEHKTDGCYELKFTDMGNAMVSNETMKTKVMFLDLLECFEQGGWTVYASVNQNTKNDNQSMTETWYCCRPVGWMEGGPVYHN